MAITIRAARQLGRMRRKAKTDGKPLFVSAQIKDGVIVGYEDRTAAVMAASALAGRPA